MRALQFRIFYELFISNLENDVFGFRPYHKKASNGETLLPVRIVSESSCNFSEVRC